jgi:hypothetical protein
MQILKPHQLIAVFIAATIGTLIAYLICNIYQAICFGMIVAVFAYSFILSMEAQKPPDQKL